jgi:chaperone BCS1
MEKLIIERSSIYWCPLLRFLKPHTLVFEDSMCHPRLQGPVSVTFQGASITVEEQTGDTEHVVNMSDIRRHRVLVVRGSTHDVMTKLLEHAMDLYTKVDPDRVNLYTWDYGWEKCMEQTVRDPGTVYLPKDTYMEIMTDASNFMENKDIQNLYKRLGIPQSRVYMFHGLPGTGKTTLAHTLAGHLKMNVCVIEFVKEMTDVGLRKAFRSAPKGSIILFEDLDCLFEARKSSDEALHNVSFSGILNAIDGVMHHNKLLVIITCNNRKILDRAIIRRVDYLVEFKHSCAKELERLFGFFFPSAPDTMCASFGANAARTKTTVNVAQKFLLKNFLKGAEFCHSADFEAFNTDYRGSIEPEHMYR